MQLEQTAQAVQTRVEREIAIQVVKEIVKDVELHVDGIVITHVPVGVEDNVTVHALLVVWVHVPVGVLQLVLQDAKKDVSGDVDPLAELDVVARVLEVVALVVLEAVPAIVPAIAQMPAKVDVPIPV